MHDIHLILSDIDGTLVDGKRIPAINKTALQEAQRRGIPIALVSGRSADGIRPIQKQLGIQGPMGCYSGALVLDSDGTVLEGSPISKETAREVIALIRRHPGVSMFLYATKFWYKEQQTRWEDFEEQVTCKGVMAPSIEDAVDVADQVYKILAITDDGKLMANVQEDLKQAFSDRLAIMLSSPCYLEVQLKGIGKDRAVYALCRHYQITPEETLAFGDFDNDLAMLKATGTAVAMGNATPAVKAAADLIADTNANGGLGKTLLELLGKN